MKEKKEDFVERVKGGTVIADKGYVSKDFAEEMQERGVKFIAVNRENMIKSDEESKYYGFLSRLRKKIETVTVAENFGLRFIRAVSRKRLAVKIILGLLAFNFYQLMG